MIQYKMYRRKFKKKNDFIQSKSNLTVVKPKARTDGVLVEFCAKSTIHGVSYFFDKKRHWIERLWWVFAFLLSIYLCIRSIYSLWMKHTENPVILSFAHQARSIGDIPFPAITICPLTKFSSKKLKYTEVYRLMFKMDGNDTRNSTDDELELMKFGALICDDLFAKDVLNYFSDKYSDSFVLKSIYDSAPSFEDTMIYCNIFGNSTTCRNHFYPSITADGLCYTFNLFNVKDILTNESSSDFLNFPYNPPRSTWISEHGYNESIRDNESYPYRVFGSGKQFSLDVLLGINNEDFDPLCGGEVQGFKILFHPPNEDPQISNQYFHVSPRKKAFFSVSPSLTYTAFDKKKFGPDVRHCFFNSERKLRFYSQYTQRNCEAECLANFTLSECGCAKFSMLRAKETKICGPAKIECCNKASSKIFRNGVFKRCKCFAACNSISYDVDISQADYDPTTPFSKSLFKYNFENASYSYLTTSFKQDVFIPSKRSEFNTFDDFLASSGGLFGLFMGASVLSFIELFYYCTLRLFVKYRQQRKIYRNNAKNSTKLFPFLS